jgi:beta-N-acetylhexosaminidase
MRSGWLAAMLLAAVAPSLAVGASADARSEMPVAATPQTLATAAYARMTPAQRVGQLFMAAVPLSGASAAQITALRAQQVGNVILIGGSAGGSVETRASDGLLTRHLGEAGVTPFISTDQEGGEVQRLTGVGFSRMPTALVQGRMSPVALRAASTQWGEQLAAAGVDVDLAPVADTVPAGHASSNAPIGAFDREYGHRPSVVAPHVVAFLQGMLAAGVDPTAKHFPGLGRATGNTDTTPGVTDPTTRDDPYLKPFRAAVAAGVPFVMVSSATYPNIDAHHLACFSRTIITSMLRGDLGFGGVVISDDFGTVAMARFPVAVRAVDFFRAGGTMLLDTTLAQIAPMVQAVAARVATAPAFARAIKAAVMSVLTAKARAGLVTP